MREHYQMCFVLKCFSFAFVCAFFDSNSSQFCFQLHKFAYNLCFVGIQSDANANSKFTGISHS